jgi:hypothetical protein
VWTVCHIYHILVGHPVVTASADIVPLTTD